MYDANGFFATNPFSTEDTLHDFVKKLDLHERGALYEMLYNLGTRYTGKAIETWRKSKK